MSQQQEPSETPSVPHLILLSAGGTGGHMFPAMALADDLRGRGYRVAMVTDDRGRKFTRNFADEDVHEIPSGTLRAGIMGRIKGVLALGAGIIKARGLLRKLKPALVVGFGGYPSFPSVYMAQMMRIPTVLHEQNAVVGKANAMLAPKADRIALSLPRVEGLAESDRVRTVVTGNPVRSDIAALFSQPYPAISDDGVLNIFIMGGSLGARVFADVIPQTMALLSPAYRKRIAITQQCREEDLADARKAYEELEMKVTLAPFIENVPEQLAKAHLVIARAGASTVAEVTAAGRPAIFVPYPYHKDEQQKINAESVADVGGAWVMLQEGFKPDVLQTRIETFLQNPQVLFKAAESSRSSGKPDAARRLGNLVTALASGWDKEAARPFDLTQGFEEKS